MAQKTDTTATNRIETEKFNLEVSCLVSNYTATSISIEKEFQLNKFYFGPRIELVKLITPQDYKVHELGHTDTLAQQSQLRIRLSKFEWQVTQKIRLGIAPFWMLGPIPARGWYQTPTSIWITYWIDKPQTLYANITLHNTNEALWQISLTKRIL